MSFADLSKSSQKKRTDLEMSQWANALGEIEVYQDPASMGNMFYNNNVGMREKNFYLDQRFEAPVQSSNTY